MPLDSGTRLGPYEVVAPIGAGGMGEVYRARDSKLERDVAIKVLPATLAHNYERLARFEREAKVLAALNHPNIATIYGREDAAIVMELVEGPTLADRLKTGPLPVEETVRICQQIIAALEAAHEKGIIHRDLKPANVKAAVDAPVKVLDFGLATMQAEAREAGDMSQSPTITMAATEAGIILGTAAYMSPEQAAGKPVDKRTDIWSFGVVLWEMLTGARLFPGGETVSHVLADVLRAPIDLEKIPPGPLRELLRRCLDRDVKTRLRDIGEARVLLGRMGSEPAVLAPAKRRSPGWLPWAVAGAALLAAAAALGWNLSRPAPAVPGVTRFTVPPPDEAVITNFRSAAPNLSVSPNGRYIAFVVDETGRDRDGRRTIWVRALDSLIAQRLDRTEGATYPFWSPDSQNIAYFAGGKLLRISVAGGAPITICDAADGEGGAWFQAEGQDGVIVFAPGQNGPLHRVLAQGGVSVPVTKLAEGETGHIFPQFLPDGRRLLYFVRGNKPGIYVQTLGSDKRTFIVNASSRAVFSPPGFLLYLRDGALLAHRWNLDTLQLEGEPVSVAEDVRTGAIARNAFSLSSNGVLAYRAGGSGGNMQVTWYTREGKPSGVVLEAGEYGEIKLSPDDSRLVVVRGADDVRDLWLEDLRSGVFSPLTSGAGPESDPVWSPDSSRVAFRGVVDDKVGFFETLIGSGKQTAIPASQNNLEDWTADGKYLLARRDGAAFLVPAPQAGATQSRESKTVPERPQPVFNEAYLTDTFRVSPDGKWVAYQSAESGRPEVTVAAFPTFTGRRQISVAGGVQPLWRADGRELFFISADRKLMAVDMKAGTALEIGPARELFQTNIVPSGVVHFYAVTRDGQRFLFREPVGSNSSVIEQLHVVTNWTSLVSNQPRR